MKSINQNPYYINRKKILYDMRYTCARLARDISLTPTTVGKSIKGKSESLRTNRLIANKLGVSLVTFWPELYGDQTTEPAENIVHHDVGDLSQRF